MPAAADDASKSSNPSADELPVLIPGSFFKSHESRVIEIQAACSRLERRVNELSATIARIDARTAQSERSLEGIANLVRTPSGISIGNAAQQILETVKRIKQQMDKPFGLSPIEGQGAPPERPTAR